MADCKSLEADGVAGLSDAADEAALRAWNTRFFGDKGLVKAAMGGIAKVPKEARAAFGQEANRVKMALETEYAARLDSAREAALVAGLTADPLDVTLPGRPRPRDGDHGPPG